jgi:hypothetical protein
MLNHIGHFHIQWRATLIQSQTRVVSMVHLALVGPDGKLAERLDRPFSWAKALHQSLAP